VPFIGRSFERSFVYIGAGPTLSQTETKLNGLIGFADINGNRTDVSGSPVDFASTSWVFGGAGMVGATYFFDASWFVDFNYMAVVTAKHTSNYYSPFYNPNGTGGSTVVGTLIGSTTSRVITQAVAVTINKAF
jgi:hypothetical protein